MKFKRKLYTRGSSFETTIPMPLLFSIDKKKKHYVVFEYDSEKNKWYVELEKLETMTNGEEKKEKEE